MPKGNRGERIGTDMDFESVTTDCFWCGTLYESGAYERCPKCAATVEQGIITPTASAEVTEE